MVWLVTTGDYEDYHVRGIYSSLESAIELIKADFPPPYIVDWVLDKDDEIDILIGHFENVLHYSIKHTAIFYIEPWEVK